MPSPCGAKTALKSLVRLTKAVGAGDCPLLEARGRRWMIQALSAHRSDRLQFCRQLDRQFPFWRGRNRDLAHNGFRLADSVRDEETRFARVCS
jgi:hypothetical protein